ncbi:Late embryogenesis abundant protein [Musa troglodytarum]|uniref:Late embryogenesis abundant protein n=1 Tax=Musa troglodytarum TaxID=320322 RepID=A0A9E7HGI8_9LILI|nr:Late embryogenesis abundant protein [Musa troglodytarum]URE40806.1 Late embryogenesis abundant protein [Musa troglodytarum]
MMRLDKQGGQPFEITEAESPTSSSGRSYCFPLLFLSLALIAAAVLIIIFVLKPKKPSFHLHAIQLDSSDAAFSKGVNVSSAIASLLLVAHNPNKLGIRYSSTELGLVYDSSNMGLIKAHRSATWRSEYLEEFRLSFMPSTSDFRRSRFSLIAGSVQSLVPWH